ncbi:CHRD domain-containing protein [Bacillus taeanensis]|uniref:CHRD domain-containing protein n=1 Tax=Bacillus taeanensis TaxID=273032 RepID=A0A366XQ01_9BACI|nr:CHRD domain-containing protein [Bacillus taeanensis]RBW67987.1 CHRD domain-containing protein [Bacillus taeanensis]
MKKFFFTHLRGENEVPPVNSTAFGNAKFISNSKKTKIKFRLEVNNMKDFIQAHIHFGEKGENGPILVFLFRADAVSLPGEERMIACKGVITGILTNDDMIDNEKGVDRISDLIKLMKTGKAYVNVHTEKISVVRLEDKLKEFFRLNRIIKVR